MNTRTQPEPEPAVRALRDDQIETTRVRHPSAARAVLLREGGPLRRTPEAPTRE